MGKVKVGSSVVLLEAFVLLEISVLVTEDSAVLLSDETIGIVVESTPGKPLLWVEGNERDYG